MCVYVCLAAESFQLAQFYSATVDTHTVPSNLLMDSCSCRSDSTRDSRISGVDELRGDAVRVIALRRLIITFISARVFFCSSVGAPMELEHTPTPNI